LDITVTKERRASIVNMNGNFDIASSALFDEQLTALMDAGETRILLDFSQVSFIVSTGLARLLKTARRINDEDGLLHICCINETVQEVFTMTAFDTILTIFNTKELALVDLV
jgi:anti-sigma B factor antagonist